MYANTSARVDALTRFKLSLSPPNVPKLSAEIEAKSSLGFEVGFGTQKVEIDCQNNVQNASKTTRFSTLNELNEPPPIYQGAISDYKYPSAKRLVD
jgi:hypothetical protein